MASAVMTGTAKASLMIDVDQSGSDVVVQAGGILNLTGMSQGSEYYLNPGIKANSAYIGSGRAGDLVYAWNGFSGPTSFGTSGLISSNAYTGTDFGFSPSRGNLYFQGNLFDPRYLDRVFVYFSSTFSGQTIDSLGLRKGIYTYTLPSDMIVVNIGDVSTVPLPASAPMFGAAILALAGFGYRMNGRMTPNSKTASAA